MQGEPGTTLAVADYDRWNRALVEWALCGAGEGEAAYLSVDEEALLCVRRQALGILGGTAADALQQFQNAVRRRCIRGDGRIDLASLSGADGEGRPCGAGFLAAMVLAAHQMAGDDENSEAAYFPRLRQVLGLPEDGGHVRPRGLEIRRGAPEEPLWQEWNRYLFRNGRVSSAARGKSNYDRYINYPLSQALLRKGDRVRLARWFREQERGGKLGRAWDRELLGIHLRECAVSLSSTRLRKILQDADDQRYHDAIVDAAAEVFDAIDWDQPHDASELDLFGAKRLRAGLYRTEHFITGAIDYWLYPKMPRRWNGSVLTAEHTGQQHPLREQRAGWFLPLWPVTLGAEHRYPLAGDDALTELVLLDREFWLLVHDPDDEASTALANWAVPAPGQTFLLLCQERHAAQLRTLKEERLLHWDSVVEVPQGNRMWFEYRECQVQSSRWGRILPHPGCEALVEALRPVCRVNVVLEGGLRVPGQPVWLEGHQPDLRLYQFGGTAELKIVEASAPEQPVFEGPVAVNDRVALPALRPGEYVIEARAQGGVGVRRLRIASWEGLEAVPVTASHGVRFGRFQLQGARLLSEQGCDAQES